MALVIDNCLNPQPNLNYLYADCCVDMICNVTTDAPVTIDLWGTESIWSSVVKIWYLGVQQNAPFSMDANESFEVRLNICSGAVSETDSVSIKFEYDGGSLQTFIYDFESISLANYVDATSINFGNVILGSSKSIAVNIFQAFVNCSWFDISTSCIDMELSSNGFSLCTSEQETVTLTWTPTSLGNIACDLIIETVCSNVGLSVTGKAIEAPSGGGTPNGQKNKVDQTTPVQQCSPRTANNRCQTAQTMQSAIRSNARRFGKR